MEMLNMAAFPRVIRIEQQDNRIIYIREFIEGHHLGEYVDLMRPDITHSLKIAINLAQILGQIHEKGILHKDLCPENILIELGGQRPVIIDFDQSSKFKTAESALKENRQIQGKLLFISPEQTGRTNKMVDHRSDLYSLGATLYYLFSGHYPFFSEDPLELIHSHIARTPQQLTHHNHRVPEALNRVILKLLEKNSEDRYQSAYGLQFDLEKILLLLELNRLSNDTFQLAERDYSGRFSIANHFLGRETELQILSIHLQKVSNDHQKRFLTISGEAGVGKTTLVENFRQLILPEKAIFVQSTFKQSQSKLPYAGWVTWMENFIDQVLTLDEEGIEKWGKIIQHAVGNAGKLLTDLIPKLTWIIGEQAELVQIGEQESQNRFNFAFRSFIQAVASQSRALIIFLDDLQWADQSSLNLLKSLLSDEQGKNILYLSAHTSNSAQETAELIGDILVLENNGLPKALLVDELSMENLPYDIVGEMLHNSFPSRKEDEDTVVTIVFNKTKGNPYFVRQFLENLYSEGLLHFDFQQYLWKWEIDKIRKLGITDNVIDLLTNKIEMLEEPTLKLLKNVAIAGHMVSMDMLSEISGHRLQELEFIFKSAIDEGVIYIEEAKSLQIGFIDERLRIVVLNSVERDDFVKVHLKLARYLAKTDSGKDDRKLYLIANHYNEALELLNDPHEIEYVAEINNKAALLAKNQVAYANADLYISAALSLLKSDVWKERYEWSLRLYNAAIEILFMLGNYTRMEELMVTIEQNVDNVLDLDKVFEYRIQSRKAQNKLDEAVHIGLSYLQKFDIELKENPSQFQVIWEFIKTQNILKKKTEKDLIDAPFITDRRLLVIFQTYSVISPVAYFTSTNLLAVLSSKQIQIIAKYGNLSRSPYLLASLGFTYCGIMGDMDKGYYYGQVAQKILDKYDLKESYTRTQFSLNFFVRHWKEPISHTLQPLKLASEVGLQTGDFEHAAYSLFIHFFHSFFSGVHLKELHKTGEEALLTITGLSQKSSYYLTANMLQAIHNLSQNTGRPAMLEGSYYSAEANYSLHLAANDKPNVLTWGCTQIMLAYTFGEYPRALKVFDQVESYLKAGLGALGRSYSIFFASLAFYQEKDRISWLQKNKYQRTFSAFEKTLKDWSKHTPTTYEHKYYLLLAEKLRSQKKYSQARAAYEKALESAGSSGIVSMQALCWELAGKFHLECGNTGLATHYLLQSIRLYNNWGAINKKEALEKEFSDLVKKPFSAATQDAYARLSSHSINSMTDYSHLDLLSILKSSQAISGNIRLEQLLENLMKIVVENAGAERGFLFLQEKQLWKVRVSGDVKSGFGKPEEDIYLDPQGDENQIFSYAVLNYVIRTRENVVLENAHSSGKFVKDAYIQKNRVKSLICLPLVNQGLVIAMLYLENNLSHGAFTAERLEILNMLTSQAAISIENAMLYEYLEEKVEERTEEVNRQKRELVEQSEQLKYTNLVIEKKNQDITASINYGSRIQNAMMPPESVLASKMKESFIYFRPRDIVSGDFYWFTEHEDKFVIAAVDCTGHGVPGAFMSMIGIDLLNSIVNQKSITDPNKILAELNMGVSKALKREDNSLRDGMDIAICTIYKEVGKTVVLYAGAKNPLIYVENGELKSIRANRQSIGDIIGNEFPIYTQHKLVLENPASFFIFSDGYQDQFGGPQDRKFMSNRFKELLFSISSHPPLKQKAILDNTLEDWMQRTTQIDDILVIGFKLE